MDSADAYNPSAGQKQLLILGRATVYTHIHILDFAFFDISASGYSSSACTPHVVDSMRFLCALATMRELLLGCREVIVKSDHHKTIHLRPECGEF